MGFKTLAAVIMVFSQPVVACNYDLVTLTDWEITPENDRLNILNTTFLFTGEREIRMIDASVRFSDILGGNIASFAMDRDLRIEPGAEFNQTGRWGMYTFERLLDMEQADVETRVCVRGVIYVDGTSEVFG